MSVHSIWGGDRVTSETVYSRFAATAARFPAHEFVHILPETAEIYGIEAGAISYADMLRKVEQRREILQAAGVQSGTRIGLLLNNRPIFLEIWIAANALGASIVPINPDLRLGELEYLIHHSEMDIAIVLDAHGDEIRQAAQNAGSAMAVIGPDDAMPVLTRGGTADDISNSQREAALLYTSGTTGNPKGCVLSNEYFLHSGNWYRDVGGLISLREGEERMLTPLPLFHMNALAVSVMAMITTGGCLIMLDRFHPRSWWESVRQSGATCLHYLGVMPSMLMTAPESAEDRAHQVRFGFGAGAPAELHSTFEDRFGFPLIEAWAMTETGSGGTISAHHEPRKRDTNCFGRPCAGAVSYTHLTLPTKRIV
jgi:acyl-CoA synthetase (AMP-forming)/AMP-acid ligase II